MAKVKQRASCLQGKSPSCCVGGVGAQPHDCWEVGALLDSCGSQGHCSDGVLGAHVLHSLACPTSCHPYELKAARFWGTCAEPLCRKHLTAGRGSPYPCPSTQEWGWVPGLRCSTAHHAVTSCSVSHASLAPSHFGFLASNNPLPGFDAHLQGLSSDTVCPGCVFPWATAHMVGSSGARTIFVPEVLRLYQQSSAATLWESRLMCGAGLAAETVGMPLHPPALLGPLSPCEGRSLIDQLGL